jgi:ribosome modulation factor
MNDKPQTIEERISAKTDLAIAGGTQVSSRLGGLEFKDMGQVLEFSKLMSLSGQAVPKHLRATPGACLAVSLQALSWHMDPFAVANKSYMVNDRIAYEAQLIHAVIEQRAPIKGRLKGKYEGEGAKRVCVLTAISKEDGDTIEYRSPEIGSITTKNSPLWKSDPDQQLWYYSARAMCRRHFPDVLLGVYEKEEIQHAEKLRDVTPPEPSALQRRAMEARGQVMPKSERFEADQVEDAQEVDSVDQPHWTEAVDWDAGAPGSTAWDEGRAAFHAGVALEDCPYEANPEAAIDWLGAWHGARKAAE